ncbi:hypothetical protein ACLB2K_016643 [Fragaria x ananassa]
MEGRDVNNDMAEIKWMLQQLAVRIDRIEARRRGRKSSDGERDVTIYHQRIDRIETFNRDGDGSVGEICVGPFHRCVPLCETGEKGEPVSFDYGEDEDANKGAIKALKKDIGNNFIDFLGVNTFLMQILKSIVNLINQIKDGEGNFGIVRLKLKRKFIGSRSNIYSKYIFIWK